MLNEADSLPALAASPTQTKPPRAQENPALREATQVVTMQNWRELMPQGGHLPLPQTISCEAMSPFLCGDRMSSLKLTSCVILLKSFNLSEPISSFIIKG